MWTTWKFPRRRGRAADVYLSKLTPNTGSRAFRRDFADVHEMHRTLLSALPDEAEGAPARQAHGVLWRMDMTASGRKTALSAALVSGSIRQHSAAPGTSVGRR
ncbi:type I-E CRISPR-associated protein Cas6/Cse3/CasE [Nocardiopsis dassonvillei]|uniref:type I-E CRISPR-associated protein Cas6/Cse3/CasE n=1 Tax=Nocardiopsis dassonvillei TaxID=2014 RepID=UPI003672AA72